MGAVYLADDAVRGHLVALKLIHTERLDPDVTARIQEEFRALVPLRHPQIASAYDFGYTETGAIPYYTREYVEGAPLSPGPPPGRPDATAASAFLQPIIDLLDALEYLHERGVLHLDIHAGNLVVAPDASPPSTTERGDKGAGKRGAVLIDFGLVEPLVTSRSLAGSSAWSQLPPELLEHRQPTVRTDLYSVGRLLEFRLLGANGGGGRFPSEIPGWGMRATLELERIVAKSLQSDPDERFESAAAFRAALDVALGGNRAAGRRDATWKGDRTQEGRLIGRERVWRALSGAVENAANGERISLWVTGTCGSGKTRLLTEARLTAQIRGLTTVEVDFLPDSGPESPLVSALRRSRVATRGGGDWLEPLAPRHGGTPAERARRAATGCVSAEGPPVVLLLDNVDLADRESRLLIDALVDECSRLRPRSRADSERAVVNARRTESAKSTGRGLAILLAATSLPSLRDGETRSVVKVEPLRSADARELVRSLLVPETASPRLLRCAIAEGRGIPSRIHRIATALRVAARRRGGLDGIAELPADALRAGVALDERHLQPDEREVVEALFTIDRAATREEVARALDRDLAETGSILQRLVRLDTVARHGRPRRYQLTSPPGRLSVTRSRSRAIHQRVADYLKESRTSAARDLENLARHLAAAGRKREGGVVAIEAVTRLREDGHLERAAALLEHFAALETSVRKRLAWAEPLNEILEATGDHERAIALFEPLVESIRASASKTGEKGAVARLSDREQVRVRRVLGVHYHRAGYADRALATFDVALAHAREPRDVDELVHIDAELAEIHIFRNALEAAEEASRRGLERLSGATRIEQESRGRMEAVLRASLGHIELRSLHSAAAVKELRMALELARRFGTTPDEAAILHNLGLAANQANDFVGARKFLRRSQRLLAQCGDDRSTVKIATNLAVIEAKLGDAVAARQQLECADRLLARHPGQRLEFFSAYARGVVELTLGEPESAVTAFETALPRGRRLGDQYLVRFGEVYLAEAHLLCGRYERARKRLRTTRSCRGA